MTRFAPLAAEQAARSRAIEMLSQTKTAPKYSLPRALNVTQDPYAIKKGFLIN